MQITIHYLNGNSASIQNHYAQKEYRDDVIIEIDKMYYEVYFFTKDALTYEMRKDGFFSLPGIIILDNISEEIIINSINVLSELHYFDNFKGAESLSPNNRFTKKWYAIIGPDLTLDNLVSYVLK